MSIRDQAWAAYLAGRADSIAAAEAGLRSVLDGLTVALDHVDVRVSPQGRETLFFSDGDVTLAVYGSAGGWSVTLVEPDLLGWSTVASVVSLADLGRFVPPVLDVGVVPDVWVSGNIYGVDAVVSHDGQVWRSTVGSNSWEPGTVHSVWVLA